MKKYISSSNGQLYPGLLLALLLTFSSCSKEWLNVKTDKTLAVPETTLEMQAIMDDIEYINAAGWTPLVLGEVAADNHFYTDQTYNSFAPNYILFQNAYTWSVIGNFDFGGRYDNIYQRPFTAISHCNVVLEVKPGDNNRKEYDHVRAQALFVRGFLYYALAQVYTVPYNAATAKNLPGLPLRLDTDLTVTSKRSTLEETYKQIIADLRASVDHLPDVAVFQTRASKPAALGLLARVYLSMGDYENAFQFAEEYLKIQSSLLDYSQLSPSADFIGLNKEVAFFCFLTASKSMPLGNTWLVDQNLYDAYDDDDLRKTLFFKSAATGYVFKGGYVNRLNDIFMGIATDEIYLIRAECLARQQKTDLAMKDLNDLLRTRWAKNQDGSSKYIDQTATNETEALTKIFKEREKQLILRGLRWSDLRRLNLDPRFAKTMERTVAGKQYSIAPNSKQYTFPFPQSVIELSGMQQNAAW